MSGIRTLLVACLALTLPHTARADEWDVKEERPPAASRWMVGTRAGYGFTFGDLDGSSKMRDAVSYQIPIQLDATVRVHPDYALGAYGAYGLSRPSGAMKDLCDAYGSAGVRCTASTVRAGAQLIRPLSASSGGDRTWKLQDDDLSGWIGWGLGFESVAVNISGPRGSSTVSASGIEAILFQGGVDLFSSSTAHVGLFGSASMGAFTSVSGGGRSAAVSGTPLHWWIDFGLYCQLGR